MNAALFACLLTLATTPSEPQDIAVSQQRTAPAESIVVIYGITDIVAADAPIDDEEVRDNPQSAATKAEARRLAATESFAEIARLYMKPKFERERDKLTVVGPGMLEATLGKEQVAWLDAFTELQRQTKKYVEIQVRAFEGPRGAFKDNGLKAASIVFEKPAELELVAQRLGADKRITQVSAPRLVAFNRQKANIAVVNQVSYIKDWKVEIVEPGPQEIADPVIDVINEGFTIDARAVALEPRVFGLEVGFSSAWLERPIPTRKIRISAHSENEVEIGEPVVRKVNFDSRMSLADGASIVFTTASPEPDKDLAIVVTLSSRTPEKH